MSDVLTFPADPGAMASFRIGELRVNPAIGEIAGPGGSQQVDPRVMAVLTALVRTPGELVTRRQLLEENWPGGAIYDDTLTQCVYQLRQHLVAAGGASRYRKLIRTLPKRGYLLDSGVLPAEPPTAAVRRPGWRGVGLAAAVLAAAIAWWQLDRDGPGVADSEVGALAPLPNAIAVLPFVNAAGDESSDYLSEGISDELRDRIAALHELRVVARRSSMQFRDTAVDAREIGRILGVGRIVEGRFNRAEGRIMVTVELVDAVSGYRLWSRSYERAGEELVLLERALASDLIGQLLPRLVDSLEESVLSPGEMAVRDILLRGRQYERQITEQQRVDQALLEKVIELYRQATEIDPLSAEAQARLGHMLLYQGSVTQAEPHILKALQLDPQRAETFTTLGLYYWAVREPGSGAAYRRAIELNPSDADALSYYASWSWLQGDANQAVVYYRAALQVDPLSLVRYADLGYKLAFQGSREEALAVMERMLQRFPTAPGYLAAARIMEGLGDLDEAIAWALRAERVRPGDSEAKGQTAELLARVGAADAAALFEPEPAVGLLFWQRRYRELVDLGEQLSINRQDDIDLTFLLAFAYSALGQHDQAILLLESGGLPETAMSESRRANDLHAMLTYLGDLQAVGREEDARRLAVWTLDINRSMLASEGTGSWLPQLAQACAHVVLGNKEEALAALELMPTVGTIARLPWLQDLACFEGLQDEPRYRAVVASVEERIAAIRARLPETLARHGLSVNTKPK